MIESISKPKLPSKYAYVLKTRQLQKILTDNNIDIHTSLVYCFPNDIASIFEAYFGQ